jgi:hypothetical protein
VLHAPVGVPSAGLKHGMQRSFSAQVSRWRRSFCARTSLKTVLKQRPSIPANDEQAAGLCCPYFFKYSSGTQRPIVHGSRRALSSVRLATSVTRSSIVDSFTQRPPGAQTGRWETSASVPVKGHEMAPGAVAAAPLLPPSAVQLAGGGLPISQIPEARPSGSTQGTQRSSSTQVLPSPRVRSSAYFATFGTQRLTQRPSAPDVLHVGGGAPPLSMIVSGTHAPAAPSQTSSWLDREAGIFAFGMQWALPPALHSQALSFVRSCGSSFC